MLNKSGLMELGATAKHGGRKRNSHTPAIVPEKIVKGAGFGHVFPRDVGEGHSGERDEGQSHAQTKDDARLHECPEIRSKIEP